MRYISTRGQASAVEFEEVLLTGLAGDGGLYVPAKWPSLAPADIDRLAGAPYPELAAAIMQPFVGDAIPEHDFAAIVAETYRGFEHPAVAPLVQLDRNLWLLELFHGPTLAFKDYALQLLGRLFDYFLRRRGERLTVVGATSGDTGSAAIEACRDRDELDIFILHPKGRISEVQRRQMTTVAALNVHNIAIEGTFDDCQDLVKGMFADRVFRDRYRLSAVNSINWARIMAQITYYFAAATALGAPGRTVSFIVPTGNFGNIYAGYAARRMGLPIERLVIASNRNDILTRFHETGRMETHGVEPSLSPSMDIQVSSNFERLLFELLDREPTAVTRAMAEFRSRGAFAVAPEVVTEFRRQFASGRCDDAATIATIAECHRRTGKLVDPHTAVGLKVAADLSSAARSPVIALATAHPAKFPEAVAQATGIYPRLPPRLGDLLERPERCTDLPNRLAAVQDFIATRNSLRGAA